MEFNSSNASISAPEYSESYELVVLMNPDLKRLDEIAVANRLLYFPVLHARSREYAIPISETDLK